MGLHDGWGGVCKIPCVTCALYGKFFVTSPLPATPWPKKAAGESRRCRRALTANHDTYLLHETKNDTHCLGTGCKLHGPGHH